VIRVPDDNNDQEHEGGQLGRDMFGVFLAGDHDTLANLANKHAEEMQALPEALTQVPAPFREDAQMSAAWGQFAVAVGEILAERGDRRLLDRLMGSADNPIVRWQNALGQAERLRADGRFEASDELLTGVIAELRTSSGTAVDAMLGPALGMAGANAFDRRDMVAAQRLTDEALRECERIGDVAGVAIYSENLADLVTVTDGDGQGGLRRRLARAQKLHDAGRLIEAQTLCLDVMAVVDAAPPDAPERGYRSKAHGLLGMILYRMHDLTRAKEETRLALEAGKEAGDEAAVVIYTANLEVLSRG
jgi:hypothetical protein